MATYTDNYQLTKPTYAEQADIGVINSNMNKIDEIMHSSQISLADAYDSTKTYAEGDVVMYELLMYKCISPTTGVWDASKWERTTASESGGGGSAELDILGEASGAVASFADGASAGLAKCIAEINPTQDLHGYSKPWAGGAGKNKAEGRYTWNINASGKIEESSLYATCIVKVSQGTTYTFSVDGVKAQIDVIAYFTSYPQVGSISYNNSRDTYIDGTFTAPITGYATIRKSASIGDMMVENGSSASSYEPYSNICPISGSTSVTVTVSDGETSTTKTTALGQTVYGGQLNVLTGILNITWGYIASYNGETLPNEWISDRDEYASGTTPTTGAEVAYKLATPQTVQLTPQEVNSLLGQNNISADTGDIDIVYVKASAPIQPNPTGTPTATLSKLGIEGTVFEVPSGGGGSSGGINYSTTEQVIGTWIDGKPLYQKTISFTAPSTNVYTQQPLGVNDYDEIMIVDNATFAKSATGVVGIDGYGSGNVLADQVVGLLNLSTNTFDYRVGAGYYSANITLTIQYTKITD